LKALYLKTSDSNKKLKKLIFFQNILKHKNKQLKRKFKRENKWREINL
jgi:hypothetical protein